MKNKLQAIYKGAERLGKQAYKRFRPGSVKSIVILSVIVLLLRDLPYISLLFQPFRTLDFLIHELGHALACLVSGGTVNWMKLGSGVTDCSCGNQLLVAQAGYLGQSLVGACLILLARYKKLANPILLSLGISIGLANLFFVRDRIGITWAFLLGASLCLCGLRISPRLAQLLVLFIAVQTALYVFGDVELVLEHSIGLVPGIAASDATHAYKLTGIPAYIWSLAWFLSALVLVSASLYISYRLDQKENKSVPGK